MDQLNSQARGRTPSVASNGGDMAHQQQPHIRNGASPSPSRFPNPVEDSSSSSIGLGLGIDASAQQYSDFTFNSNGGFLGSNQQQQSYPTPPGLSDASNAYDNTSLNQDFTSQLKSEDNSYGAQAQNSYLTPNFGDGDFTIFPPTAGDQFTQPLFVGDNQQQLGAQEDNMMTTQNTTPPHLLSPDPQQPSSAQHSPAFNQHQFSPAHSRNASLGPEAAFLPGQIDWSQAGPQFQGHRRSPSEFSDMSSAAPSPNLVSADTFEQIDQQGHSPMHRPQDAGLYNELHRISNFSISDQGTHSPNHHLGRSPSHSPAVSPRIMPQQLPDMHQQQQSYLLQAQNNSFGPPASYGMQQAEAFPSLPQGGQDMQQDMQYPFQAPPAIQVVPAPDSAAGPRQPKNPMDVASLTPPERGRPKQRQRAVTDPFSTGGINLGHRRTPSGSASLSPASATDTANSTSRSLSPLERGGSGANSLSPSPNRRRHASTSSVPNNVMALRLADPEYAGTPGEGGQPGAKGRSQKHPATFQCSLCPKRFTRAYNLRSHLRTHTDERPFVCTVCSKAFARQHDRKRHEGLHSGEKKFVCKGELKTGGQWGCGRRFARADALGRHFRSEAGRICIKPLLDDEYAERHRLWQEQRMASQMAVMAQHQQQGLMMPPTEQQQQPGTFDPATFGLPAAILAQYPALAGINWNDPSAGGGMEDDLSGRSSFGQDDFDEGGDDGGYVSGPGTGFGQGGLGEGFGEMGYASDYGGR